MLMVILYETSFFGEFHKFHNFMKSQYVKDFNRKRVIIRDCANI